MSTQTIPFRTVNFLAFLALASTVALPTAEAQTRFSREFAPHDGLVAPVEKPQRSEMCLNGSWQFQPVALPQGYQREKSPIPALTPPTSEGWDSTPIRIPSPWNVNSFPDNDDRGGDFQTYPSYPEAWKNVQMGWLRRTFTVPASWRGKRLILHFGAVAGDTQVFVNGQAVGEHNDIFLPFDLDVTQAIRPGGTNTLLVGVRKSSLGDVQGKYGRRSYQGGSFWGQQIAGIWQDVFLEATPEVHITDVFVKPLVDKDTLEAQVTIRNDTNQASKVNLNGDVLPWVSLAGKDVLLAPEARWKLGTTVALKTATVTLTIPARSSQTVTLSSKVGKRLKFWAPQSPNLYGLVCHLGTTAKTATDTKYTRFGWRQLTFANGKTLLNGQPIALKGDSWHFLGIPQMTRRYAWAWYQALKAANLNAVRLHAQPYPSFYLDVADEQGIMVLDESAIWASDGGPKLDSPNYWADTLPHIKNLVLRDRNHPSVFGWSVSNEVMAVIKNVFHGPKEMQNELVKHFALWADICRQNDTTRPWISADGEDDGEGTLPTYVIHYGGPDSFKRALATGKPWGVGESGPAYYGSPEQIAQMSGNPRSYLSFEDRMEGVAAVSYKDLRNQRQYNASYSSVFNLVWYALKPLEIGLQDTTRPATLKDGIFFPPFVEGKPGVQPERLGPYCTTLNPGYDSRLPLYATWPLFDAIRAAQAEPPQDYQPAHRFEMNVGRARSATEGTIKSVRVLSGNGGQLASALNELGVSVAQEPSGADSKLLFIDGAQPPALEAKVTLQKTLDTGGTVFVWGANSATLAQLNALLPFPLELTNRTASSLVVGTSDALTAGLTPASLYFSEKSPSTILPAGLGGTFVSKAVPLLSANNTEWKTWNGQSEPTKTAKVLRSEREAKASGVAVASLAVGQGRIVVSNLPIASQISQATALNRTLLANLGVALGASGAQRNMLDASGKITRVLAVGRYPAPSAEAALAMSPVAPNSGPSIISGARVADRTWTSVATDATGNFVLQGVNGVNAGQASSLYLSFWLYSPKDLSNLLLDPHLPTLDLVTSGMAQVWLNAQPVKTHAEGQNAVASPFLLQQGWNHVLVKAVRAAGANSDMGLQLRSNQTDYLSQLRGTQQGPDVPETGGKPGSQVAVAQLDAASLKARALAEAEKAGGFVVSSERDEKGTPGRRFITQGNWNYPGVWTTPEAANRAIWQATLPASGQYHVAIWYGDDPNSDHATSAVVKIQSATGETQKRLNLRQQTGQWFDLGTYRFEQGQNAQVTLEGQDAGGNLLADMVRFVPSDAQMAATISVPSVAEGVDGTRTVKTANYEASLDSTGALPSFRIGGQEFLTSQTGIPHGAYLYQDGLVALPTLEHPQRNILIAKSPLASVRYEFSPNSVTVTAQNTSDKGMTYYVVFDPAVNALFNTQGNVFRPFVNQGSQKTTTWFADKNKLTLEGGDTLAGPWQDKFQLWSVGLEPQQTRTVTFRAGQATEGELAKIAGANATPKPVLPPQHTDIAAPKLGDDGNIRPEFLKTHQEYLQRIKEGPIGLLFVGDSITNRWRNNEALWQQTFGKYQPANFGIEGDQTQHVLWRFDNGELDGIHPKVVVVMIGTNNMGYPAEEIVKGDTKIVAEIHRRLPDTKVLLLGIFPRGASASDPVRAKIKGINAELAKLDNGSTTRFLDFGDKFLDAKGDITRDVMPDALHPAAIGYQIWADAMKPLLDEMMK